MRGTPVDGVVLLACSWFLSGQLAFPVHASIQQDAESAAILHSAATQKFVLLADQILSGCSQLSKNLGLPFIGADYFIPDEARLDQGTSDCMSILGKAINLESAAYWFTFRLDDGKLASFYNPEITTFEDGKNSPLFDTPDAPTWTKEKTIALATKFRDILIKSSDAKLGSPFARYVHTSYSVGKLPSGKYSTKSHIGNWSVYWPRIDNRGHLFDGDGVNISLSEKYGLIGVGINIFTPFVDRNEKIISQSDAMRAARWHITSTLSWERYLASFSPEPYETVLGDKLVSSDLEIVIPNHFASWNPFSNNQERAGLLVWSLWFEPIHKGPATTPTYDDRFAVWVDAYSGAIVGGDAML